MTHANDCISSVPLALFVLVDAKLKRKFSMKVINRKALTPSVIGRFDLSMTPSVPSHAGDVAQTECKHGKKTLVPAHAEGWLPAVSLFCHPFLPPACRGHRRAEPCAED